MCSLNINMQWIACSVVEYSTTITTGKTVYCTTVLVKKLMVLRATSNCKVFSGGPWCQTSLDPAWLHTHSSFSSTNLKSLLLLLLKTAIHVNRLQVMQLYTLHCTFHVHVIKALLGLYISQMCSTQAVRVRTQLFQLQGWIQKCCSRKQKWNTYSQR